MNEKSSGRGPSPQRGHRPRTLHPNHPLAQQQPLTSPRWLMGALFGVLSLAASLLYAVICLLFWQGQWQMSFHPSHAAHTPIELPHEDLHFDATETGTLQLHGWWVPADPAGKYARYTILFLHDGEGSLPDSSEQLRVLHGLGINLLAFDYRGFGDSVPLHPSEKSTREDADAAWHYLTETRKLRPPSIVIYGVGLGAAIAAETAKEHPEAADVILENPRLPVLDRIAQNPHMRWLPLRIIFQDRFDPGPALSLLKIPKLFLYSKDSGRGGAPPLYFEDAAQPKESIFFDAPPYRDKSYLLSLLRFLESTITPQLESAR